MCRYVDHNSFVDTTISTDTTSRIDNSMCTTDGLCSNSWIWKFSSNFLHVDLPCQQGWTDIKKQVEVANIVAEKVAKPSFCNRPVRLQRTFTNSANNHDDRERPKMSSTGPASAIYAIGVVVWSLERVSVRSRKPACRSRRSPRHT